MREVDFNDASKNKFSCNSRTVYTLFFDFSEVYWWQNLKINIVLRACFNDMSCGI